MENLVSTLDKMRAYHSDPKVKTEILRQLVAHREADEIVKGRYWEDGKGCAVGCTIHSDNHVEYETRFGIPQMLARLEDAIFEGLPNHDAKEWPLEFMDAIKVGADLSRVGWQFLHWLLTDKEVNPGIEHRLVRDMVKKCADVLVPLTNGKPIDSSAAAGQAYLASWAERAAGRAYEGLAARSALVAVHVMYSASYANSKHAGGHAASAVHSVAESTSCGRLANKLLVLLKEAT